MTKRNQRNQAQPSQKLRPALQRNQRNPPLYKGGCVGAVLRREEEGLVQRKQAADTLCLGSPPRFRHELYLLDPVGQSLRAGVKRLGQVLFELTGTLATLHDSIPGQPPRPRPRGLAQRHQGQAVGWNRQRQWPPLEALMGRPSFGRPRRASGRSQGPTKHRNRSGNRRTVPLPRNQVREIRGGSAPLLAVALLVYACATRGW
jgi:hypothetical protein